MDLRLQTESLWIRAMHTKVFRLACKEEGNTCICRACVKLVAYRPYWLFAVLLTSNGRHINLWSYRMLYAAARLCERVWSVAYRSIVPNGQKPVVFDRQPPPRCRLRWVSIILWFFHYSLHSTALISINQRIHSYSPESLYFVIFISWRGGFDDFLNLKYSYNIYVL